MKRITQIVPFLLVSLLFLMWGVANNMNDTLLAAFRRIMSISDLQSSLVQFAFFGAYFCFAIPAAMFIKRYTYKAGILLGLALYAVGTMLFYPAGAMSSYPFFLFAIYVMAGGCAILETTANPYILSMGNPDTSTRRLNIAQTFNPVGAIIGILISRHFILSQLNEADAAERASLSEEQLQAMQHSEFSAVSEAYLVVGAILLVLLLVIAVSRMPKDKDTSGSLPLGATFRRLFANRRYRFGVIAQFFYVGVQTGIWSFTIRYVMHNLGVDEAGAAVWFLWSIISFTLFRFIFTWLMKYVAPARLLVVAATVAILFTVGAIALQGMAGVICLVAISACMSLMFPTIYGIALDGIHGDESKIAASGLIMAILGGALITPMQGALSDMVGVHASLSVPVVCLVTVLLFALYSVSSQKRG